LGMFGAPIERAELAVGDAHVCVVDVSVDDVRDDVLGMQLPSDIIREPAQLEQRGALVEFEVGAELGTGPVDHQATWLNGSSPPLPRTRSVIPSDASTPRPDRNGARTWRGSRAPRRRLR